MTELEAPGLRADVVNALDVLATITPETIDQWPGLTEAVHWLVDDTWWDQRDPAESIGFTLRDEQEVAAIKVVLTPLLAVLNELGPVAPDASYLQHQSWPDVRTTAAAAHRLLTST